MNSKEKQNKKKYFLIMRLATLKVWYANLNSILFMGLRDLQKTLYGIFTKNWVVLDKIHTNYFFRSGKHKGKYFFPLWIFSETSPESRKHGLKITEKIPEHENTKIIMWDARTQKDR